MSGCLCENLDTVTRLQNLVVPKDFLRVKRDALIANKARLRTDLKSNKRKVSPWAVA